MNNFINKFTYRHHSFAIRLRLLASVWVKESIQNNLLNIKRYVRIDEPFSSHCHCGSSHTIMKNSYTILNRFVRREKFSKILGDHYTNPLTARFSMKELFFFLNLFLIATDPHWQRDLKHERIERHKIILRSVFLTVNRLWIVYVCLTYNNVCV